MPQHRKKKRASSVRACALLVLASLVATLIYASTKAAHPAPHAPAAAPPPPARPAVAPLPPLPPLPPPDAAASLSRQLGRSEKTLGPAGTKHKEDRMLEQHAAERRGRGAVSHGSRRRFADATRRTRVAARERN